MEPKGAAVGQGLRILSEEDILLSVRTGGSPVRTDGPFSDTEPRSPGNTGHTSTFPPGTGAALSSPDEHPGSGAAASRRA